MQFKAGIVLAAVGLAAAQSSSSVAVPGVSSTSAASGATSSTAGTSGCGPSIDNIIANCLLTYNTQVQACTGNDWRCLCDAQTQVKQCYINCPSDPRAAPAGQQQTVWCNAAKTQPTSSTTSYAQASTTGGSGSTGAVAGASSSASATGVQTGFATASGSGASSASSAASSGSAATELMAPAGGLIAAIFGLLAAF